MLISRDDFLSLIKKNNCETTESELKRIGLAYDFCCEAHKNQKRKSGEPYAIHPIEVALKVSELQIDDTSIIAALLHDVVEDTIFTRENILNVFGIEVANIVEGVTKFDKIKFERKDLRQVENFRKLFLALSKDIRVLIIKLCDRCHNMETLCFQKPEKQQLIALETMEIYAPLAERVGLQKIKRELQECSFKILRPEDYNVIKNKVETLKSDFASNHIIDDVKKEIYVALKTEGIEAKIDGREKTIYSIWNKMQKKNLQFDEITDIFAFRIIVKTKEDCYRSLGVIHTKYNAIPGKFKDFISVPKSNCYKSLHTKIMGPKGRIIDIQIRTQAMHNEDEYGLASHWKYKQGLTQEEKIKYMRASWISRVLDILENSENKVLLNDAKIELQERQVMAFTHDGEVVYLPYQSKILDFAFAIDEKLGINFDYAVVNMQQVGFDYVINNGDKITIYTSDRPSVNTTWFNYVITGKAKNAIIEFLGNIKK